MSADTPARLQGRRQDVYAAIHLMEQDLRDGSLDRETFERARLRYETEAAALLQREEEMTLSLRPPEAGRRVPKPLIVAWAAVAVLAVAVALFLANSLRARSGGAAITGNIGSSTPALSSNLMTALNRAGSKPRSIAAQLALAQAYVNAGRNVAARATYLRAVGLSPRSPEARTLYAMFEGASGQVPLALAQLRKVEADNPQYARAWLVDGLLSSRITRGLPRAVQSWKHFLLLTPHASVAPQVRALLQSAELAARGHP